MRRQKEKKGAVKEKVIRCGPYGRKAPYIEISIYPNTESEEIPSPRRRKIEVTAPRQKRFNDKKAIRYLFQLIKTNFASKDCRVDLTYSDKFLPKTKKEADRMLQNYIDRVNRRRFKAGLPKAEYICVTEYGSKQGRVHHHLLISGGLDRDEMESLWCDRKRKGKKERELLGYVNCDRLRFTKDGIEGLSIYITKEMRKRAVTEGQRSLEDLEAGISIDSLVGEEGGKGARHWKQSKGLKKPWYTPPSDTVYTRKKVLQIIQKYAPDSEGARLYFEQKYKGYELTKCIYEWNEYIGAWSIELMMHLKGHEP